MAGIANLWKLGGQPTSFNPLPVGVNNWVKSSGILPFTLKLRAKSPSGTSLVVQYANGVDYWKRTFLTSEMKEYTFQYSPLTQSNIYLIDDLNKGDIVIDSIELVRAPLPAIPTLDTLARTKRVGSLTSEQQYTADPILSLSKVSLNGNPLTKLATATVKANLDGKVVGSTDLIPHAGKAVFRPTLQAPSSGVWAENSQTNYSQIAKQDGTVSNYGVNTTDTNYAQQLFSFDLIRLMQDKFGSEFFADSPLLADKVNKLKNLLTRIQADWWGFGSTVLSNYAQSTDFTGKVDGSTVENPNILKVNNNAGTLLAPSATWQTVDGTTGSVIANDGTLRTTSSSINGNIAQMLFSFNLIEYVKRKYGFTPDVNWLKANITKLTANWWGFGSTVLSNPAGTTDFASKVSGSVVENANIAKYNTGQSTLQIPTGSWNEDTSANYTSIITQDTSNVLSSATGAISGNQAQQLFSFNLIEYVQRKYSITIPGADTASKVAWLKTNISSMVAKWYGCGSSVGGNKAYFDWWKAGMSSYGGFPASHTISTVTSLQKTIQNDASQNLINAVDANGFCHFIAYADPSDGVTASTINTDYVSLDVTMVAGSNKANLSTWQNTLAQWQGFGNNSASAVSKVSNYLPQTGKLITDMVDANGFVHFLAYADASNGLAPSVINTDYISLDVEVTAGSNKASIRAYANDLGAWGTTITSHTSGTVTKLSFPYSGAQVNSIVDANGFMHLIAYADPSNGVNQSVINTDYIELTVDINAAETGYDVYVDADTTHQLPKLADNLLDFSKALPNDIGASGIGAYNAKPTGEPTQFSVDGVKGGIVVSSPTTDMNPSSAMGFSIVLPSSFAAGDYVTYTVDIEALYNGNMGYQANLYDSTSGSTPSPQKTLNKGDVTTLKVIKQLQNSSLSYYAWAVTTGLIPANTPLFRVIRMKIEKGNNPDPVWSPGRNKKKTLNFLGKVTGSVDSVPHRMFPRASATIDAPSIFISGGELSQSSYDLVAKQDGTSSQSSAGAGLNGQYGQRLFEFDLSHLGLSLADLKAAFRKFTVTWVGWGRGDNAGVQTNGVDLKIRSSQASGWGFAVPSIVTAGTPTSGTYVSTTQSYLQNMVDNNQKVYVLVHSTYPASAAFASEVYTDYVKLDIELADYVDYVETNAVKVKQADPSKVKLLNVTTRDVVDIEYVKNDKRVYPKKNLVPTQIEFWAQGSINAATGDVAHLKNIRTASQLAKPNTTYYVSARSGYEIFVFEYTSLMTLASYKYSVWGSNAYQITTGATTAAVRICLRKTGGIDDIVPSDVLSANPQLEEGAVATPWEPYTLIGGFRSVNPSKKVPKKNMFDGQLESGVYSASTGAKTAVAGFVRSVNSFKVNGGKTYTVSARDKIMTSSNTRFTQFDSTGAFVKSDLALSITVQPNTSFLAFQSGDIIIGDLVQLEEGATATPYEAYQLIIPPSKPGLKMDGLTSYLQLPSMTMDSVEIDCLIDSVQPKTQYCLVQSASSTDMNLYNGGKLNVDSLFVNGTQSSAIWASLPVNSRFKAKLIFSSVYSFPLNIFTNRALAMPLKGTIYGIKCYLNGQVVKEYDTTALMSLATGKLLPKAKNLMPNFEDVKWSLNANTKVLGKDVLRLDATAANQDSKVVIEALASITYAATMASNASMIVNSVDAGGVRTNLYTGTNGTFTTRVDTKSLEVVFTNGAATSGSFEFVRPHLFLTDGTEAQVFGAPVPKVRSARRVLYRKR